MLQIVVKNDEGFEGSLRFNHERLKRFTQLSPKLISITHLYSSERRRVERFIEQEFHNSYSAEITQHYPTLMSVRDENDNILAALGFRYAVDEKLFLEQYLDRPVEELVAKSFRGNPVRGEIVEIGNLASSGGGASIFLFTALAAYLDNRGFSYVTVTATDFLHNYFKKIGLRPKVLSNANQEQLIDGGESWGSYYKTNPRILAGMIAPGYMRLKKHLNVALTDHDGVMVSRLHYKTDL